MRLVFFIESPLGIICVGLFSSVVGSILFKLCEKIYAKANNKVKYKRFIKRLVSAGEVYCSGYTAAYAKYKSSFHQILHVNSFMMSILREVLNIIIVIGAALGLMIALSDYLIARPIIIALAGVIVAVLYQRINRIHNGFKMMYDHEFDEEYNKRMMDGVEKYWAKLTKNDTESLKE